MHYLLPFVMVFGFLSMLVSRGSTFGVVMPLVLVALSSWSLVALLRVHAQGRYGMLGVTVLLGVTALVVFAQCRVVAYDDLGPSLLGAPFALAFVWSALVWGSAAIAMRFTSSWLSGTVAVAVIAIAWSLVVDPAAFILGLFSYHRTGLYYGVPFLQTLFWGASASCGALLTWWSTGRHEAVLPLRIVGGPLLVLAYATGVCVATGAWIPAVVGLILSQLGLRAMYYL